MSDVNPIMARMALSQPVCRQCLGWGHVWVTPINPSACNYKIECEHCHGDGWEPAPKQHDDDGMDFTR